MVFLDLVHCSVEATLVTAFDIGGGGSGAGLFGGVGIDGSVL